MAFLHNGGVLFLKFQLIKYRYQKNKKFLFTFGETLEVSKMKNEDVYRYLWRVFLITLLSTFVLFMAFILTANFGG